MMSKVDLRTRVRERLNAMDEPARARASDAIVSHALASPAYLAARVVLLFAPMPGEPDLSALMADAIERDKSVLLPRIRWAERSMDAARIRRWPVGAQQNDGAAPELIEVRPGLFQPTDQAPAIPPGEIDLVLVPGLAFDAHGGRLGRGAGFYDRFLGASTPAGRWCGVAFECQLVERVPTEPHDQPVTDLLTESGWRRTTTPC